MATPTRIRLTTWVLVTVFLAALASATVTLNWSVNERTLDEAETQVRHFSSGAGAAMNRMLLSFDVLLASTDELLGLSSGQGAPLDESKASQLLRGVAQQNLLVRYVAIVDVSGKVLTSSDPAGDNLAVELPPGFLRMVLDQPISMLAVSRPSVSFTSSERVLYLARQLSVGEGRRLVAVAQVPVSMLMPVLMQSVDIPGLEVTLERRGGELLLSMPVLADADDVKLAPPLPSLSEHADWSERARLSRQRSLVVAHPTVYQDLWISASLPKAIALEDARAVRYSVIAAAVLLSAMLVVTGALVQSYLIRINAARRATAEAKATLDQALASMVSGFLVLDAEHRVVQWNQRYEEVCYWLKPVLAPGVPFRALLECTARQYLPHGSEEAVNDWVRRRMQRQAGPTDTHEQRLPMGMTILITERAIPGGGLVLTCHDVTALRRASEEAESLAFYDPLTALPNRRLLLDRLTQAVAQAGRSGSLGALLFLDLDQFKLINDTRGHEVGDQLLQLVGERLKGAVRASDTVARLGGDEFVVVLTSLGTDSVEAVAQVQQMGEKILHSLNLPYSLRGQAYRGVCSIGATLFGQGPETAPELLRQADIAMYQAKSARGNALCFFDPQMQAAINQRALWESELQTALAEEQFTLYYQIQVTADHRIVGAEALLRWRHPQRGLIAPGEFIAVAEDCGLIVPLGLWVLRTACRQLARWQHEPACAGLQLSINVSARQFRQSDFADIVIREIREAGAPAHLLKLELTESLMIDHVDDSIAKMYLLRTQGVRFSVDDFGTGYSSLAYLTRLPLHQLKIDQSFVRNLGVRAGDDAIVQTIIGMARTLELEVIAEGVETEAQREFLGSYGCDLYQGYLFSPPVPLVDLQAMVIKSASTVRA
ncbi:bifunctional diguanylate cyclase/phosphodiesterase [Achromobacter aloeverae]|uniref:Diguanylate cyclase n=1 Tax=Achromobacter aloeverae TaxID=1750518 RepID=A0A4Q1HP79_9BURK|nr:EAL domain-containing protein [Achromobacter aloeverae]RXN92818.1 diguanylate cyclase [Achromobacter aloeverae]